MKKAINEIFVKSIDYRMDDIEITVGSGVALPKFTFEKWSVYTLNVFRETWHWLKEYKYNNKIQQQTVRIIIHDLAVYH